MIRFLLDTPELIRRMPWRTLWQVVQVVRLGIHKHRNDAWYNTTFSTRYWIEKLVRHLIGELLGHEGDHESGLPPLAHGICNAMMHNEAKQRGLLLDDRAEVLTDLLTNREWLADQVRRVYSQRRAA